MNLKSNKCIERINIIKKNIDSNYDQIKHVKNTLEYLVEYIKRMKIQNPDISTVDLRRELHSKIKDAINSMNDTPTRSDIYQYKTIENIIKNPNILFKEIETESKTKMKSDSDGLYRYTSDMERNLRVIINDIIPIMLSNKTEEYKNEFQENRLSDQQKRELNFEILSFLKEKHEEFKKEIKNRYAVLVSKIVSMLHDMGLLEKYNNRNNDVLSNMNLPMLKFDYIGQGKKCGLLDLTNVEFIKRFSTDDLIAMASFYCNRLTKEIIDYDKSLYIAEKVGIIDKASTLDVFNIEITDDIIRELLVQMEFLKEISKQIITEQIKISKGYEFDITNQTIIGMDNNKVRRKAIDDLQEDYKQVYEIFLPDCNNELNKDLDIATILETDKFNLYLRKDFAIESLIVNLLDKNTNINWGYIAENNNGNNSVQNKEKFILIGIDMKGYNMPIKLHFDRERLKTFVSNYTRDFNIPVYEGNDDMKVEWNGFITTQVLMPLDKEQRKVIKGTQLDRSDYRYHFLEHIKWMMLPNRYPSYLCDHQGKKKERKYINLTNGIISTEKQIHK